MVYLKSNRFKHLLKWHFSYNLSNRKHFKTFNVNTYEWKERRETSYKPGILSRVSKQISIAHIIIFIEKQGFVIKFCH